MHSSTPLHDAVNHDKEEIVKSLLVEGTNVNAVNELGQTPLHNASKTGKVEIMKTLLNFGADVYLRDYDGKYPLHHACVEINNDEKAVASVDFLLKSGTDVDACTMKNLTPLYLATEKGHSKIVELLLQHKPEIDNECNKRCLYVALNKDDENSKNIFAALLEYGFGFDPEVAIAYPNIWKNAVCNNDYKFVEDLLKLGLDVNFTDPRNGETPLHFAAYPGVDIKISKLLLSYGAQVDVKSFEGQTPILLAIKSEKVEAVKLLLSNGFSLKQYVETLPYIADDKDFLEIFENMLTQDESLINGCDENGKSALHYYASRGRGRNSKIIQALLEKGANVHSKNADGLTPLHMAVTSVTLQNIEILLQYGADVNAVDNKGRTALYMAIFNFFCRKNVVKLLLEYGTNINIATTKENQTPLDFLLSKRRPVSEDAYREYVAIVEEMISFIIKLKSAGFHVSDRNLKSLEKAYQLFENEHFQEKLQHFQISCEEEISRMKSYMAGNAKLSFYNVLRLKTSSLARFLNDEDIIQVFETEEYETRFPIYASMIKLYYKQAMKRKELLENGLEIFQSFENDLPKLNTNCIEEMLSYLNTKDLLSLIDAGK